MQLAKPPTAKRLIAWLLKNKQAVVNYFKAANELSKLTLIVKYRGKRKKVIVTFTGKGAELNVNLDSLFS